MKKSLILSGICALLFSATACEKNDETPDNVLQNRELTITEEIISTNFVGNGAQWGGYDVVPQWFDDQETLSDQDWETLFTRIDYMRPPFLRIMTSADWAYMNGDDYDVTSKTASLYKMLDYSQSRNIEITYGEWGHHYIDNKEMIDTIWIANSVKFLDYLVNTKGYTCIKTVNIINEPNGSWSSAEGSYDVWKSVQELYIAEMANYSFDELKLMGPDIAIFNNTSLTDWISRAGADLDDHISLYDIHVYPAQQLVRDGDYTEMLKAYKQVTPADKRIVLGEIGFKYSDVDTELKAANEAAIEADPFAGDDSNMMVYKSFYGVDMADAMIQSMIAGFSGALVWSMDDAMYNQDIAYDNSKSYLKRWGFWNIVGEELCNDAQDEEIRPAFYPVSLLTRYFPAGSDIYEIDLPTKKGVRAIMGKKDDKYTIAIVNSHYSTYPIVLKADALSSLTLDRYDYKANADESFTGTTDENGFATPSQEDITVDLTNGYSMTLEGEAFILLTNME